MSTFDSLGCWEVMLAGQYTPYDDSVQCSLEAAYCRGEAKADVSVRGVEYTITLRGDVLVQSLKSEPTRTRLVRRRQLPAAAAAVPATTPTMPAVVQKRMADDTALGEGSGGPSSATGSSCIPTKRQRVPAPNGAILVFAPGAGGSTSKSMRAMQAKLEAEDQLSVVRCDDQPLGANEARWNTMAAGGPKNIAHIVAVTNRIAAKEPERRIILCGASFGCRVIAETLRTARAQLPTTVANALICCGYPLNPEGKPEGADQKRPQHLLQLPATTQVLMVQGDEDAFNGPRGIVAIKELIAAMSATAELFVVPGGQHTVPEAKGLKQRQLKPQQVETLVRTKISQFVTALAAE